MPTVAPEVGQSLSRAVQRFARATADILEVRKLDIKELPHQRVAFNAAVRELDAISADAPRDLRSAFARDRGLIDQAVSGKTVAAVRAMMLEREVRTDPVLRADRFVEDWQRLGRERRAMNKVGDFGAERRATAAMRELAHKLEYDPGVDSLLHKRARELGIEMLRGQSMSHSLQEGLGRSRDRGPAARLPA